MYTIRGLSRVSAVGNDEFPKKTELAPSATTNAPPKNFISQKPILNGYWSFVRRCRRR